MKHVNGQKKIWAVATWHPAGVQRDMPRLARGYLIHVHKAVRIAAGQDPDPPPRVLINPSEDLATKLFAKWRWFAIDIETPSTTDNRLLSVAVSGDPRMAMAWEIGARPRKIRSLARALRTVETVVIQNGAFDGPILNASGYTFEMAKIWDTMIEFHVKEPDEPVNLSYLLSVEANVEAWKHLRNSQLLRYNGYDAAHTARLYLAGLAARDDDEEDE